MIVGAVPAEWVEYKDGWTPVHANVIEEGLVTINVNGEELVTIMCTPKEQDWLALGFLWNEGLIGGIGYYAGQKFIHIDVRSGRRKNPGDPAFYFP